MTDGNAGFDVHGGCTGTERRMGDMVETLGPNGKYILTILLVLALVGLVAWLLRQFGAARRALSGSARNRQPRLALLDHIHVDTRRKLVMIRRDNVEHLVLLGGPTHE